MDNNNKDNKPNIKHVTGFKNSIASKFIKYIVALILILVLSLIISIRAQEKLYNENFEKSIKFASQIIGESIKNAMIIQYYSFLTTSVEKLASEDNIVYAIILSDDDRVMESTIDSYNNKQIKDLGDKFSLAASFDTSLKLRKDSDPFIRKQIIKDRQDVLKKIEELNKEYPQLRLVFTIEQVKEKLESKLKDQSGLEEKLEEFYLEREEALNDRDYDKVEILDKAIKERELKLESVKTFVNALEEIKTLIIKKERKTELLNKLDSDNLIYEVSVPLLSADNEKFGSVRIGYSYKEGRRDLRVIYVRSIVIGVIFLIAGLVLSVYLSKKITNPIAELAKGAEMLGSGNLEHRIRINTGDEIELLANSLNNMAEKLDESYSNLEKKVQERTREYLDATKELQKAYRKLQATQSKLIHSEKMTSLGQLVAGVAHELNNPIGFVFSNMSPLKKYIQNILTLIEMYKKIDMPEEDRKIIQQYLDENDFEFLIEDMEFLIQDISEGAERAQKIVLDLKNFSRLDEAEYKEVDIHQGIDSTLNLLRNKYKHRVEIHKEYGDIPLVNCYASQLNQVWMNLLSNAAQSIENDGDVWISTSLNDEKYIEVRIKDNGSGIKTAVLEKIFDPFFTTKPVGEGTGLGLSISHSVIKKHGGIIEVDSELGKGTTFIVKLPLNKENSLIEDDEEL